MGNLLKLEIKKVLAKKDVMLILGILILAPFLFGFCMMKKIAGLNFEGQVSIDSYGIMIWSFLKYLFVLYLVPVYIACCFMGKEIENRSINIMLSNERRGNVLWAKVITYIAVITIFFVMFQGASVLSYMCFIQGTESAIAIEASVAQIVFLYLFQWLEMIFILLVSVALCCVIKGNAVLLLGIGVVILQKMLVNVESVQRILPYYISDYNYYNMIPTEKLMSTNMISIIIYAVLFMLLVFGTVNQWRKRDF